MEVTLKPWGMEEILYKDHHFVTKILTINPGHRTSLQYHEEKTECLVVRRGTLWLQLDILRTLREGQEWTIKPGEVHRLCNYSEDETLELIECSTNHLEDVVRLEDDYSRIQEEEEDLC